MPAPRASTNSVQSDAQKGERGKKRSVTPVSRVVKTSANGIPVETVHLGAKEGTKAPLDIVIIPGNPGVPSFYSTFASHLWELLDGGADIEIVGYLGHSTDNLGVKGWFTLQQQMDHVVAYLEERNQKHASNSGGGAGTIVIGHSIGAEMAVHAMHTLGVDRVRRVVGLMPFLLVNRDSRLQRFLSALVHLRPLVHLVAALVGFIRGVFPAALRRVVLDERVTKGMDPGAAALTLRWLRRESVVNMALMGRTEFDSLQELDDRFHKYADRLGFLYCRDDHWAPLSQHDHFKENMPESMHLVLEESPAVEHAFVLSDEAAAKVAGQSLKMLRLED